MRLICFLILLSAFFASCTLFSRNKQRIYNDFFGKAQTNCTQILNARDARAFDDPSVWIHFKTCPEELKRILAQVPYTVKPLDSVMMNFEFPEPSEIDESLISTDPPRWWVLKSLGDTCLKFEYFHPDKDYAQFAYISLDSTEVFYHDANW